MFVVSQFYSSLTMKTILLLGAVLFFHSIYAAKFELAERILRTLRKCGRTHHLKFQDIQAALRHGQLPSSDEGKCFVTCTLQEFGLIKDNVFSAEGSYALNELRFSSQDALNKANEITKACEEKLSGPHENICDLGIEIAECGVKNSQSAGIISADLW